MTVHLPDDLAARVAAVAAERGVTAEQIVTEALQDRLSVREASGTPPSFIGIGASGTTERVGARHREIIREAHATKAARDV